MSTSPQNINLPQGWLEQYDPTTGSNFYVDTNVHPPRVSWAHPFEDREHLAEHPGTLQSAPIVNSPGVANRRRSFAGTSSTPAFNPSIRSSKPPHKRGLIEKLKDKAMTSIEAREERRRQQAAAWQQRLNSGNVIPTARYPGQYASQYPLGYPGGPMGCHRGFGGGALPILGGFAGGMVLGDMLDGGLYDGGMGGGGFGGGFDGGGFGF